MTTEEFKKILDKGETDTVEFKSWFKARNQKEIIALAVDELIAFANHKGGTVYFGVEDKPVEVLAKLPADMHKMASSLISEFTNNLQPLLIH